MITIEPILSKEIVNQNIKALLRDILIEGQVLWEVEWIKKEGQQEGTSFEDEEELKEKY